MKAVSYYFSSVMKDITCLGGITFYFILLVFSYFFDLTVFYKLLIGAVLIYAINVPLKLLAFKDRPLKMSYKALWEKFEASSFPSVHSARAVFLALVFYTIPVPLILKAFVFLIAAFIIFSRVYLKKHFWSDAIAGIIIGLLIFYLTEKIVIFLA
ncbi:MAG: phosphatase PAP2 family protein [Candidatus Aenigmarchaeota archaeon]|nr:phosphatase PAP2 family protein [Candidatus Aenigmarchaeota archaeon]MDI6722496.1 phosphatase PAP2 family protein [Candidatus Aenigmarchaeota archaeon]